jgi:ubiquinone/menaquinone biosynthesis C-methylase UbiE
MSAKRLVPEAVDDGLSPSMLQYARSRAIALYYDDYYTNCSLFKFDVAVLDALLKKPGKLLDLGCGTGRHVIHFARRGFDVTGVDLSEHMLAITRAKAREAELPVTLIRSNICDMPAVPDGRYDYALCMFSTLGMIRRERNRINAVREIRRKLAPGGKFIAHFHNMYFNIWDWAGIKWLLKTFLYGKLLPGVETGDKYFKSYRGISNMYLHLFSLGEIKRLFRKGGFEIGEIVYMTPDRTEELSRGLFRNLRSNGFIVEGTKRMSAT